MRTTWNFFSAGQVHFGSGAVRHLGELTRELNVGSVLVVTDPALVKAGLLDAVRTPLEQAGISVSVFDQGEPEPAIETAVCAGEAAGAGSPDAVLGLGGGSNMDLAKFTAVLATHGGRPHDYFNWDNVPGPICPLICVPTTSGTGSEVSHAAVLTDTENKMKVSCLSNRLRPTLAVVDPELTLTCPPQATADSGIDALTHAVEAYTAVDHRQLDVPAGESWPYDGKSPLADCLAEEAIRLIGAHLRTAVAEPDNLPAREGMALASTLAGMAFSNAGVALVHALEYPLGGELHCSHGAGNGLLLPYVMRFNLPEREAEIARIGGCLGVDSSGMSQHESAQAAITAVEQLRADIGIPQRIRELGGTEEQLPGFAAKSFAIGRLMTLNPRRPTEADLLGILQDAL